MFFLFNAFRICSNIRYEELLSISHYRHIKKIQRWIISTFGGPYDGTATDTYSDQKMPKLYPANMSDEFRQYLSGCRSMVN